MERLIKLTLVNSFMKYSFIDAKSDSLEIKIPEEIKNKRVGLLASVQFLHNLKQIKNQFKNAIIAGQVIGCNASNAVKIKNKVDCFFILSEGRFHALEIARKTGKDVYVSTGEKIGKDEVESYRKKLQGKLMKFYNSKTAGILVSLKPGQYNLKLAESLKEKYSKTKEVYIFIDETFNIPELENFPFIDMFINTACSRIESDDIINAGDLI